MNPSVRSTPAYFHGLDGLRFIAFLVVLGSHLTYPLSLRFSDGLLGYVLSWFQYGYLAVDLFFVLSAFLISWWGWREIHTNGDFRFGKYFIRRSLRIWPLYILMVLISLMVIQLQAAIGMEISEMPSLWYYLTFTLNFAALEDDQFLMVILWSLSVEEQYYIFNGIVLKWLRKYFVRINVLVFVISTTFRITHLNEPRTLHYHTLSVMACFAVGNILAFMVTHPKWYDKLKTFFHSRIAETSNWLLLILLAIYPAFAHLKWLYSLEKTLFAILFAITIGFQVYRTRGLFSLHGQSSMNYLGKISYGLYCFHGLVIAVLINLLHVGGYTYPSISPFAALVVFPVTSLLLTIVLAHMSYRWFEKPILKFKNRFQ